MNWVLRLKFCFGCCWTVLLGNTRTNPISNDPKKSFNRNKEFDEHCHSHPQFGIWLATTKFWFVNIQNGCVAVMVYRMRLHSFLLLSFHIHVLNFAALYKYFGLLYSSHTFKYIKRPKQIILFTQICSLQKWERRQKTCLFLIRSICLSLCVCVVKHIP